jgi:hypothetical protein
MKSYKTDIPPGSLIQQYLPADYADTFVSEVTEKKELLADDIIISLWTVMPGWVNALFKLRNILVRPFGLETGESENHPEKLKVMLRSGSGSNGLMSVTGKSDNETVILLSDKHLDTHMSVYIEEKGTSQLVMVITLVHYHNRLGKIYFFFIRPFHKVIVKSMLKSTLKRLII